MWKMLSLNYLRDWKILVLNIGRINIIKILVMDKLIYTTNGILIKILLVMSSREFDKTFQRDLLKESQMKYYNRSHLLQNDSM